MTADQDVDQMLNGLQADGTFRPWAFVKVRARTVLGNLKAVPFSRQLGLNMVAATPSAVDHLIGTAEQVSWRYVASDGNVWDLKDYHLVQIELMLAGVTGAPTPTEIAAARIAASQLRPWPVGYAGKPTFE